MSDPSPYELWQQAGGEPVRYQALLREHGLLLMPGDPGYEEASAGLPCGWQPGKHREEDRCADCTGRTGDPEPGDPAAYGPWFSAAYPGRCSGCDERIEPEDKIRADGEGGYLCADCGREENRQ